jgi:hypothetical protein
MQAVLENIEQEVQSLSVEELAKVKTLIETLIETKKEKPKMTEEEFEQYLFEKGIISEVKPPITDFSRYDNYKLITVTGEPISETIIKERR